MSAQKVTWKRPTAAEVAQVVRWYYGQPGNGAGGTLHVVLDDHNWAPVHVRGALEYAREKGDGPGQMLALLLLSLSHTQRIKAIKMGRRHA